MSKSGDEQDYFINKILITASYVSRAINRPPGVVGRAGRPAPLSAAFKAHKAGFEKNISPEVQISNHGNPSRRIPLVIPGRINVP